MKPLSVCIVGLVCSMGLAEVPLWSVTQSAFIGDGIGLAMSPQREVYVQTETASGLIVTKYRATGSLAWSHIVGYARPMGLTATRDGGVLSESDYVQKGGGVDKSIRKVSPSGAIEWTWGAWAYRYPFTAYTEDQADDVYIGFVPGAGPATLDKINGSTGALMWRKEFAGTQVPHPVVDSANRCVLVLGTNRYVFASDGTELQHTVLPIPGPTYQGGVPVAIDDADHLYVTNSIGRYGKFDPNGQTIFTGTVGSNITHVSLFNGEALLTYRDYSAGTSRMAKVASDGAILWTQHGVNGAGDIYRPAFEARFDSLGGVIGGGGFANVVIGKYRALNGGVWFFDTIGPGDRWAATDLDRNGNSAIAYRQSTPGYTVSFYAGGIEHTTATLERGVTAEHSHHALYNSSDGYWRLRPGPVLSTQQAPISFKLDHLAPAEDPASMSVVLESRATSPAIRQDVWVYNFSTATWTLIESASGLPTAGPDRYAVIPVPNPVQHVGQQREIRVRVEYRAIGPVLAYPWTVSIDRELVRYIKNE